LCFEQNSTFYHFGLHSCVVARWTVMQGKCTEAEKITFQNKALKFVCKSLFTIIMVA